MLIFLLILVIVLLIRIIRIQDALFDLKRKTNLLWEKLSEIQYNMRKNENNQSDIIINEQKTDLLEEAIPQYINTQAIENNEIVITEKAETTLVKNEITWENENYNPFVNESIEEESAANNYIDIFINWFKQDWPMKVWWLVLILWIGWFLMYAVQNNRISPMMRIVLWIITSLCMIWFWRIKSDQYPIQWSYLIWLWSATYIISILIWFKFFWFFWAPLWLLLIALQYCINWYISYKKNNHWMNDVSLFFSLIAPFLFSIGNIDLIFLFFYLWAHLIWNIFISIIWNRTVSRICNVFYLIVYVFIWLSISLLSMWNGIIISIITLLVIWSTLVELYIENKKQQWFSLSQLMCIAAYWIGLFWYIALLYYNSVLSSSIYASLLLIFFIWYWAIRYQFSSQNKQNLYSLLIAVLSILFLWWLTYQQFAWTEWLTVISALLIWAIQITVTAVTKEEKSIDYTSFLRIIPFILLVYNYSFWDASYLLSVYSTVMILCGVSYWFRVLFNNKNISKRYMMAGIALLHFWIINQFTWSVRIIVLEWILIVLTLMAYIVQIRKTIYLSTFLALHTLPIYFILIQWIKYDTTLFWLIVSMIIILGITIYLSNKMNSENNTEEDLLSKIIIGLWVIYVYLSIQYIIPKEFFTISYTLLWMMLYLIHTRYVTNAWTNNLLYASYMAIPIMTSIWLNTQTMNNEITTILSSLLLSISLFRIIGDNKDNPEIQSKWYIMYAFMFLYFWIFSYNSSKLMTSPQNAIVILLIIFAFIGVTMYILWKRHDNKQYRTIGAAIIIWVILRVLWVELRKMNIIMRIITCLVIWSLLVWSGFLGNKPKDSKKWEE
jgi:hypothetical protein